MKAKILFITGFILFFIYGYSGNGELSKGGNTANAEVNGQDTTVLPPCGLKTAFLGEFETEAVILKKEPEGDFFSPYIAPSSGKMYLIQNSEHVRIIKKNLQLSPICFGLGCTGRRITGYTQRKIL